MTTTTYHRQVTEIIESTMGPVSAIDSTDAATQILDLLAAPVNHARGAHEKSLALVMEFGSMLAAKDEWDMDDNFDTTEALYALYCEITGHGDPS